MTSELFKGNHLDQRSYISSLCRFDDINKKIMMFCQEFSLHGLFTSFVEPEYHVQCRCNPSMLAI